MSGSASRPYPTYPGIRATRGSGRRQSGAALVTVLWVVVVLMVIVTSMATGTRREARLTGNLLDAAQLRERAKAGITLALQDLSRPGGARRFIADGRWYDVALLDGAVRVAVLDERGRVDINAASLAILRGLFRQAGLENGAATAVAENVIGWREGGVEGAGGGRPFHSADELQRVPGVDAALYRRLSPVLTVHARANRPAPDWAPPLALAAYPGMSLEGARRWVQERAHQRSIGGQPPPFPASAPGSQGREGVYTLRAVAAEGDARGYFEATVRMTGLSRAPYQILEWRQTPPGAEHWSTGNGTSGER